VDTTAPTIASVAIGGQTGAQNGLLNVGDTVTVLATFSETVSVNTAGGVPTLKLKVGSQYRDATYSGGTGTSTLSFTYTVSAGDTDGDGISVDADSLALNGGTIRDLGGTNATLSHAAAADNGSYKVDTTAPTVAGVTLFDATGRQGDVLNAGDTVTLEVSFSEAVYVDTTNGVPKLKIRIGSQLRDALYVSGDGTDKLHFTYTIEAGQTDTDGISVDSNSLIVAAGAIRDRAGTDVNPVHASVAANASYKVDTTAPTVTSVVISGQTGGQNNLLNVGDTVTLDVTFSEAVYVDTANGQPRLKIKVGSDDREAVYAAGSGSTRLQFTYTIAAGDMDGDGISLDANGLSVTNSSIRDFGGTNANLAHSAVDANPTYKVDTQPATIASVVIVGQTGGQNNLLNAGDTVTLETTFSKVVFVDTGAGAPRLTIDVGGQTR
ncbi:hypothetical protein NDN16_20815, partial [Aureimonas altamirensis]|uniref:hypothetical protein n=1 Tax=Aureimonas altamirensis TaxID=370622 RepID=UPI002036A097